MKVEVLAKEVSGALRIAGSRTPEVLEGLRTLGISYAVIAQHLGVSQALCSYWNHGKLPIAERHRAALLELLRCAYVQATKLLSETASKFDASDIERGFTSYRTRVRRAGEILRELEQHNAVGTIKRPSVSPRSSTSTESGT